SGGHAKLLDFGTARRDVRGACEVAGTPGYIAPDPEPSPRGDVYAFGVTLLEVLEGMQSGPLKARLLALGRRCTSADALQRPADGTGLHGGLRRLEPKPRRGLTAALAFGVAAVVLGGAAMAWAPWRRAASPPELDELRLTAGPAERLIVDSAVSP